MIEKLKYRIKTRLGNGILHNSREDVNFIAEYLKILTEKINEIADVVNNLQSDGSDKK